MLEDWFLEDFEPFFLFEDILREFWNGFLCEMNEI